MGSVTRTQELFDLWPEAAAHTRETYGGQVAKEDVFQAMCHTIKLFYATHGHTVSVTYRWSEREVRFTLHPQGEIHTVMLSVEV